jgi:addiction module RelB/DinJ family antitoxin
MKTEVVRARIEADRKAQAAAVLAASGFEVSDAIRLFFWRLVRERGLPFRVKSSGIREVSGEMLWRMKRSSQARDRELVARGAVAAEDLMLIKPKALRGARIRWPNAKLSD